MTNTIHIATSIVASVGLLGCFQDAPRPGQAPEAPIVFAVKPVGPGQDECRDSRYIAGLVLTQGNGVYVEMPWMPASDGSGCQSGVPVNVPVQSFVLRDGATPLQVLSDAAMTMTAGGQEPPIAVTSMGPIWAFVNNSDGQTVLRRPSGNVRVLPPTGPNRLIGLVVDEQTAFVAYSDGDGGMGGPNNPRYPCCGPPSNSGTMGSLMKASLTGGSDTMLSQFASFRCVATATCMVGTGEFLFYFVRENSTVLVKRFPKTGAGNSDAVTIGPIDPPDGPVGIAANETHVVWAGSNEYTSTGEYSRRSCQIRLQNVQSTTGSRPLLVTTAFSCSHVAIDDQAVYFTIVDVDTEQQAMHGIAIGRVSLDGQRFESLDLGILGGGHGPRRVYLDGDDMFAIDPQIIARIPKSALDGKQDIAR
jgi:hypothetical protein